VLDGGVAGAVGGNGAGGISATADTGVVAAEVASADPFLLVAVTATLRVAPASVDVSRKVCVVAEAIIEHSDPDEAHLNQW